MILKKLRAMIGQSIKRVFSRDIAKTLVRETSGKAMKHFGVGSILSDALIPISAKLASDARNTAARVCSELVVNHDALINEWATKAVQGAKANLINESGEKLGDILTKEMLFAFNMGIDAYVSAVTEHRESFSSRPFPPGTRFAETRGECDMYVIEMVPSVRTINHMDVHYTVSMPYLVLVVQFMEGKMHNLFLFFRKERISSVDDVLHYPCLPNINTDNGRLCIASYKSSRGQIDGGINEAFSTFMGSKFNNDWSDCMRACFKATGMKNLIEWESKTTKNQNCGVEIDWPKFGADLTIRRFLDNIFAAHSTGVSFDDIRERVIEGFKSKAKELILTELEKVNTIPLTMHERILRDLRKPFAEAVGAVIRELDDGIIDVTWTDLWQRVLDNAAKKFVAETVPHLKEVITGRYPELGLKLKRNTKP